MNASRRAAKPQAPIAIVTDEPKWRAPDLRARLRRAARLALARGGAGAGTALTILLTNDATLRRLNREFRRRDKPTNVLSFPAAVGGPGYLGDIAIAFGVAAAEARAAGRSFADHAIHLAIHGVLHLLGYDHERAADAATMEGLEVAILAELGIADPYAARATEPA